MRITLAPVLHMPVTIAALSDQDFAIRALPIVGRFAQIHIYLT